MGADMSTAEPSASLQELLGHAGWARSLARQLVSDAATAEDLVQEALLAALRAPPRRRDNLRGWLGRVVRNSARQRARHEGARPSVELEAAPSDDSLPPDVAAAEAEERRRLAQLVLALDEPYRATLLLRYWHGLEPKAIAERLGIPAGTVRWRIKDALDRLRAELDRSSGDRKAWILALLPLASRDVETVAVGAFSASAVFAACAVAAAASAAILVPWRGLVSADAAGEPVAVQATDAKASSAELSPPSADPVESTRVALAPPARGRDLPDAPVLDAPEPAKVLVRARALDAEHAPLAGATLAQVSPAVGPASPSGSNGVLSLLVDTVSPAAGSEPRPDVRRFVVRAPSAAADLREQAVVAGIDLDLGDVVLQPGGDVSGRVLDAEGRGLAGAWIEALEPQTSWTEHERWMHLQQQGRVQSRISHRASSAGADGSFVLHGLPVGHWKLAAGASGAWPALCASVEVRAGERTEHVELVLERVTTSQAIAGGVLHSGGEPVPDAKVALSYATATGSGSFQVRADAHGQFDAVLPPWVEGASLEVADRSDPARRATVRNVPMGSTDVVLRLSSPAALELRVLVRGPEGEPLKDARIGARAAGGSLPGRDQAFVFAVEERALIAGYQREADGTLVAKLPGVPFLLDVHARGFASATLGPFEPAGFPSLIECTLQPIPIVRGMVHAAGAAAAGARVSLFAEARTETTADGFRVRVDPEPLAQAEADAQGRFELQVLPPRGLLDPRRNSTGSRGPTSSGTGGFGSLPTELVAPALPERIYVRIEHPGSAPLERGPLASDDVRALDLDDLTLSVGGAIAGRVFADDGLSPAGAIVGASRGDGFPRTATVGDDGVFRYEGLTPGPWEVRLLERAPKKRSRTTLSSFSAQGSSGPGGIPLNCTVEDGGLTSIELMR